MADVSLNVTAVDRGARRLISDLVRALLGLKQANREASVSRETIQASKNVSQALRDQLEIAQALVRDRQRQLAEQRRIAAEEIRLARETARATVETAQRRAATERTAFQQGQQQARERVQQARDAVRQEVENQRQIIQSVRSGIQQRITAERQVLQAANDAAKARVVFERQRLRDLIITSNREKAIARERIADARRTVREAQAIRDVAAPGAPRQAATADLRARRQELQILREQSQLETGRRREQIQLQREILTSAQIVARERIRTNRQVLRDSIQSGRQEIAAARETARQAVAAAQDRVRARIQEARQAGQSTREVIAQGRAEIAAARQGGRAAIEAARIKARAEIASRNTAVGASRARINQLRAEARTADQTARQQERAFNRANAALLRQGRAIPGLTAGLSRLRSTVLQLVSAYAGFRAIFGFIRAGFRFNQLIESSKLGIAALITAQSDLVDTNGRLLTGTEALAAAQGLAKDQLDKLRIAGIQTAATTEELVTAFQEAVGAGLNVGLTLDQIRKYSVLVAQAASAIHLPMNQLQQETRSILQGTIDRNSRIAKSLNLTNAMVNQAKAENRLFELLNQKFKAFNIAGIESLKTWATLKTTIADAFSVFAGLATEPLFESIRDAGQAAIARIFDFETAQIRENFRGLIEGLRTLFGQLGEVFSSAIRTAVDRAEELSRWFRENRQEVRETAAAVATMVAEFGKMIAAIGQGIVEIVSLGREVNTVTGAARVLSAAFQAVADNVKLIIGLLAGRALFVAIGKIAATLAALKGVTGIAGRVGVALGGRAAVGLVPGVGTIVATVLTLAAAYKLLKGDQQAARLEAARLGSELDDQRQRAVPLIEEFVNLTRALEDQNTTKEESIVLDRQLESVQNQLIELDKSYAAIIGEGTGSLKERREALLDLLNTQQQVAAIQEIDIRERQEALKEEQQNIQKALIQFAKPTAGGFVITDTQTASLKARLQAIQEELQVTGAELDAATGRTDAFVRAFKRVGKEPAKIRTPPPPGEGVGGEPQFVRQARANLERIKAEIERDVAQARLQFEQGAITHIDLIQFIAARELGAIEAERALINALREKANQDLDKARKDKSKTSPAAVQKALDELAALATQELSLDAKVKENRINVNRETLDSERDTAKAREEIEIAYLRAIGRHVEAAQREIRLKHEEQIRDAITRFGQAIPAELRKQLFEATGPQLRILLEQIGDQLPEEILKLKIGLDREAFEGELKAIEDEVTRAEEQRNREVEAIRARFAARGKKLNIDEQQARADAIAAANERAAASFADLELRLRAMRDLTDPADTNMIAMIDTIIARIHTVIAGIKSVDLEARRLREGLREALEGGLTEFFQEIGDGSRTAAGLFKQMVKSIIDDMRRLVAQLIASSIIRLIFGTAAKAATGQATGNTTQSGGKATGGLAQRRAAGGPARPPHGVLHGGIPGKDSITISAMPEEYFLRREATRKYGAEVLDLFNEMRVPITWARELYSLLHSHFVPRPIRPRTSFAAGGPVGRAAGAGARPVMRQEITHIIGVDRDGLLTFFEGPKGRSITLGHVGSAPRFVGNLSRQLKRVP